MDGNTHPVVLHSGPISLSLNDYQERAVSTAVYPGRGTMLGLLYVTTKLTGEAGEYSEKVGKAIRDDGIAQVSHEFKDGAVDVTFEPLSEARRQALKKELGDIQWYV